MFVFFCYEFRKATKDGTDIEKKRSPYYVVCGIAMAAAMLFIVIVRLAEVPADLGLVFWGEAAALTFFGVAWIISGKAVPYLSDREEQPELYSDIRVGLKKMGVGN